MKRNKKLSKKIYLNFFYDQRGQISKILIILAAITLVVIVVAFLIFRLTQNKSGPKDSNSQTPESTEPPKPVYETTIGDVRLLFESAQDLGNVLKASYQSDLKTTEKFIKVVIGAQNKGKKELQQGSWDIGNIVDSAGRNFIPLSYGYAYLPREYQYSCGAVLKPEFEPISCVKIYEVSKVSTNLKVEVSAQGKKALIDLDVK